MRSGFTLLEVLLTIAILLTGTLGIIKAMNAGLTASQDAQQLGSVGLNIAKNEMEEIKDTVFSSLADSGPTADANFPDYTVTVGVEENTNPMLVAVAVNWATNAGGDSLTLVTLMTDVTGT